MSPEQARGRDIDKRSDVFAFGSVVYEMLTGVKAFRGDDISEILAAVIKTEPDWSQLSANLDPRIRKLLERCFVKDPRERLTLGRTICPATVRSCSPCGEHWFQELECLAPTK